MPAPPWWSSTIPSNPTALNVRGWISTRKPWPGPERDIWLLSDIAYAEIYFGDRPPPSILEAPGAIDVAIEFGSMIEDLLDAGLAGRLCRGNTRLVGALTRVKSYLDYGAFTPMQVAATAALNGPQDCVQGFRELYRGRRDRRCRRCTRPSSATCISGRVRRCRSMPATRSAPSYVIDGAGRYFRAIEFDAGRLLVFRSGRQGNHHQPPTDTHFVIVGGAPMDGPRHIWWNFVSSRQGTHRAGQGRMEGRPFRQGAGRRDRVD